MPQPRNQKQKPKGVFLLSIGDELLDGRTQNTNASWFGEQLRLAGVAVAEVRCVSDRIEDITKALRAANDYPLTIVTGGLGPTNDDRTMEAAAKFLKTPLQETKASLAHVKSRYEARGLELTSHRRRLALVPKGSIILDNPTGTAPGVRLKRFFFLPGPPSECRPMFTQNILPLAQKMAPRRLLRREFWRTFGKGESDVYNRIAPIIAELEKTYPGSINFGVHISFPCIDLTLEAWDAKKKPSGKILDEATHKISAAVKDICFTRERENLADAVFRLLKEKKLTVSAAESCTGGLVGKMLTDMPGSSDVYLGGVISYAYSAKEDLLGVKKETLEKYGAVSEETVREMAEGCRTRLKSDFALALSGISGPGGGLPNKPVGTIHVALSSERGTKTLHQVILFGRASRDQNRIIAAHLALDALRTELLGFHGTGFPLSSEA